MTKDGFFKKDVYKRQAEIRRLYEKCGYVIDTHTAVASAVYGKYVVETGDHKTTVIASTASPVSYTHLLAPEHWQSWL